MEQQNWRDKPVTDKQLRAIKNLSRCRGRDVVIPKNKGEAADAIAKLLEEMKATAISRTSYSDYPNSVQDWNEAQGGW